MEDIQNILKSGLTALLDVPSGKEVDPYFYVRDKLASEFGLNHESAYAFAKVIVWHCMNKEYIQYDLSYLLQKNVGRVVNNVDGKKEQIIDSASQIILKESSDYLTFYSS